MLTEGKDDKNAQDDKALFLVFPPAFYGNILQ